MHDATIGIIRTVLESAGIAYTEIAESVIAGQTVFMVVSDDTSIGRDARGEVIRAIDHLVKRISESAGHERTNFIVDANEFETRRIRELEMKARMMAERARSFQYDVELAPMSAYERLLVHSILAEEPSIATESRGEGRERRIVIKYVTPDPSD